MKWIEQVNLPKEEGFYWARTSNHNWWNLIVRVYGDSPFFNVDAWAHNDHVFSTKVSVYDIEEFGPLIALEAPKMEGVGFKQ